jgi:hypothetical protein
MAELGIIRVCDVLNQALPPGSPVITDHEIVADCTICGQAVQLSDCKIQQTAETTYRCECGCTLVIIGPPNPDQRPWPGRGFRLKDFVLRNAANLRYRGVLIPRSPNALAAERGTE